MEDISKLENKAVHVDPNAEDRKNKERINIHEEFKSVETKGLRVGGGFGGKRKVEKGKSAE